jgi:hypothetical protein
VSELAAKPGVLDQPGVIAFLVIFGMGVILFFVFRSMAKHLRKVNLAARAEAEAAARAEASGAAPADEQAAQADEDDPAGYAGGNRPSRRRP